MNVAILTAGGSGTRMNNSIPKQFITVNEIPIIIYTLRKFQENPNIDSIIIACLSEWQTVLNAYIREFNISKVAGVVDGGSTGIESISNCFRALKQLADDDVVMIHDGNRPMVSDNIIDRNIAAAVEQGATSTYIDIHDGIVNVDGDMNILPGDFNRDNIKSTQTPHAFQYKVLDTIFNKIETAGNYISLADAAAKLGYRVSLVKGSEVNFKITTKNDLAILEAIINKGTPNV